MAYVARPSDFQTDISPYRAPAKTAGRRGFLRRLYDTMMESRQRRANRDIAAYLAMRGHRLTDSIERELNDRLFNGGWHARR